MKIHLNDNVAVLSGKYRGKGGKVIRVIKKLNQVVVEKINIRTKHIKKKQQGQSGQIIRYEAPIPVSAAAVICPSCGKKTRVKYIKLSNGKNQRVCRKCNQSLDTKIEKAKKK